MNIVKTDKSIVKLDGLFAAFEECNSIRLCYHGGDTVLIYDTELLRCLGESLHRDCCVSDNANELLCRKSSDNSGALAQKESGLAIAGEVK